MPAARILIRNSLQCDILLISIPPKLKKGEALAYLPKLRRIIKAISLSAVKRVIYISSTGVYGDHNKTLTEPDEPMPDTETGQNTTGGGKSVQGRELHSKHTVIRFGGLVGPRRHPGRFFAGKKDMPNGLSPVNFIHLDDCVGYHYGYYPAKRIWLPA